MSSQLLEQGVGALLQIAQALERIAAILERIAPAPKAPNYLFDLEAYPAFDWASIEAVVVQSDGDGAAAVRWCGQIYNRRSPTNKFSEAIWYSRCIGKDESGENQYERLCTFKRLSQAEPVPERVARLMR